MSCADELDVLLYAWLAEPEAGRAESRFTSYFQAAFPAICRYLRSLHADPAIAQDLAQQALIRLFNHLGKGRREVNERLRQAVAALRPLELGALHVKQVHSWRGQVGAFEDAAVGFRPSRDADAVQGSWQELRHEINARIPPLIRQGVQFLSVAKTRIEPGLLRLLATESLPRASPNVSELSRRAEPAPDHADDSLIDPEVERFLVHLLEYAQDKSATHVDKALGCVGALGFVTHTDTVRASLPALAIPSNGLLYTIAKRQLLDSLRATRFIDRLVEVDGALESRDSEGTDSATMVHELVSWTSSGEVGDNEFESDIEERYRTFLEFLRAPLTRAEGALAAAAATGKAKAEQARVESLQAKHDRLLAILAALREEPQPTEEQIAQREGLTRNQVKYVIEQTREAFAHFFPDLVRETRGRRKRQGGES